MLELRNVSAANRRITQLNFSVTAGEIVALIGRNGAGKTTLLRLALGLIRPTAGMVRCTVGAVTIWMRWPPLLTALSW